MKMITDKDKIDEILTRSISEVFPSKDKLMEALLSGKKLKIYIGTDATGSQLHLGHATNYMLLEKLRQLGHEVVVLFGDFTAMIGDPTDKMAERVTLTKQQVEKNIATWKSQISKVVSFTDKKNPATIVKNSKWLSKLTPAQLLELAANFTVQQMAKRDMFDKRLKEDKSIFIHEFLYPLLQGYDSVAMDVDMEIGGTDQMFNMLAGRTLQKRINNREKFVMTTTLLTNPVTGKKLMSKSEGNYIALNDTPQDMLGKVMALADETIVQVFIDCTYVPMEEISEIKKGMEAGKLNPRDIKIRLAKELIKIYHSEKEAQKAEEYFINTFSKRETPADIPEIKAKKGELLSDVLVNNKIISSKSEFRRLVDGKAVDVNEKEILDMFYKIESTATIKVGKKKFVKIIVK